MPTYEMTTHGFLKEIFEGKKKLMKLKDINHIQVPKYDEISVKNLYQKFLKLKEVAKYFPEKYAKGRQCDRDYMFNIVNTLHPEVMEEIVEYAQS